MSPLMLMVGKCTPGHVLVMLIRLTDVVVALIVLTGVVVDNIVVQLGDVEVEVVDVVLALTWSGSTIILAVSLSSLLLLLSLSSVWLLD